jgi:hypothetical protein
MKWLVGSSRLVLGLCLVVVVGSGCATYSDGTLAARNLANAGNYTEAIESINGQLKVESGTSYPQKFRKNDALLLLERGMLHQANGAYKASRGDLQVADKEVELLDFTNNAAGTALKYIFSDSSGVYKISPVERLSLNAVNILNYLADGDLAGARVESRRFTTMRNYLNEYDPEGVHGAIGSYLSGFVMERLGETSSALHHYDDSLQGKDFATLYGPVKRLSKKVSYRGLNLSDYLSNGAGKYASESTSRDQGEILIVAGTGRVPYKVPERLKIGAAIGLYGAYFTGDLGVLERSATKVLVFPKLVPALGTVNRTASARVDGVDVLMEEVTDLGAEVEREYAAIKPKIITAALTRFAVRAAAAEGVRIGCEEAAPGFASLCAIAFEATMVALDKPDTRSWTMLPQKFFVSRVRVAAGQHEVQVAMGGSPGNWKTVNVNVPKGGFAVVVVNPLH